MKLIILFLIGVLILSGCFNSGSAENKGKICRSGCFSEIGDCSDCPEDVIYPPVEFNEAYCWNFVPLENDSKVIECINETHNQETCTEQFATAFNCSEPYKTGLVG